MRLLIVDDDQMFRDFLASTLRRDGYQVVSAPSTQGALSCLRADATIEVVMTDWMMPDLDGLSLLHALRAAPRGHSLYVILLSGRAYAEDVVTGLGAGADDYLIKPVSLQELRARLTLAARNTRTAAQFRATLAKSEALRELVRASREGAPSARPQQVIEQLAALLPADRVVLIQLDHLRQRVLRLVAGGPGAAQVAREVEYQELMGGLTGEVIRSGQGALSPKSRSDPRESPAAQARREVTQAGSIMVVPIHAGPQLIATLTAIRAPHERDFGAPDLDFLTGVAGQIGVALYGAGPGHAAVPLSPPQESGVGTQAHFLIQASRYLHGVQGRYEGGSLLRVDIDFLQAVNANYGSVYGDAIMQTVEQLCEQVVRHGDLVGRVEGDSFLVLLAGLDTTRAHGVAERLRREVEQRTIQTPYGPLDVTVSIGVSQSEIGSTPENLLSQATEALLHAKERGRNQVRVYEPAAPAQPPLPPGFL